MLPLPLQSLAAWFAVWLGRVLQEEVDYLTAENLEPRQGPHRRSPTPRWAPEVLPAKRRPEKWR